MKSKLQLLGTALLAGFFCVPISAQQKLDVTSQYLVNPSFEGGKTNATASETCILSDGGGQIQVPDGWTVACHVGGWMDTQIIGGVGNINQSQCTDGNYELNVWCGTINNMEFSQTITNLPNGKYTLTCDMMTSEAALGQSRYGTQRIFAVVGGDTLKTNYKAEDEYPYVDKNDKYDSDASAYSPLRTLELAFEVTDGNLTIGVGTGNAGKTAVGGTGFMKADNVRLYLVSEDEGEIIAFLKEEIGKKVDAYADFDWNSVPTGYRNFLYVNDKNGYVGFIEYATELAQTGTDTKELEMTLDTLSSLYNQYASLNGVYEELLNIANDASILRDETKELKEKYKGWDAFNEFIEETIITNTLGDPNALKNDFQKTIDAYPNAYKAFLISYEATESDPADFTAAISCPDFTKPQGDPATAADGLATGWATDNDPAKNDQYRLNMVSNQNCWNSWNNNFKSMKLYQELTNMPMGMYSVSCETATNGTVNDQHAFITSSSGTAVSAPPSAENCYVGSNFQTEAPWETLNTEKILVTSDGKLTIGMASTSGGDTSGWFCATNFQLKYYGKENIEVEYKKAFDARIEYAQSLTENAMLPKESATLNNGIATAQAADLTTVEKIESALNALNTSVKVAEDGNKSYTSFKEKNYKAMTDSAAIYVTVNDYKTLGNIFNGYLSTVDKVLAADTTTSAVYHNLDSIMGLYIDFGKAYTEALTYKNTDIYKAEAVITYGNTLVTIVESLKTLNPSDLETAKNDITKAINILKDESSLDGIDVTFWIKNPDFEKNPFDNGWTNNGFKANTNGQLPVDDGFSGITCAEQWTWNGKLGDVSISQDVYVPNGTYTLSAAAKACQQGKIMIYQEDGTTKKDSVIITTPVTGVYFFANDKSIEVATPMIGEPDESGAYENSLSGHNDWPHSKFFTIENIVVTDNVLTIGMKTVSTDASWAVIDAFKLMCLTRTQGLGVEDVNQDSNKLVAYVENGYIKVVGEETFTVTSIDGRSVSAQSQLAPGVYIVKAGTKTVKLSVQ